MWIERDLVRHTAADVVASLCVVRCVQVTMGMVVGRSGVACDEVGCEKECEVEGEEVI